MLIKFDSCHVLYGSRYARITQLPLFLIITARFAIVLILCITKRAVRLLLWVSIIFVILLCLGIVTKAEIFNWFENLFKVGQ